MTDPVTLADLDHLVIKVPMRLGQPANEIVMTAHKSVATRERMRGRAVVGPRLAEAWAVIDRQLAGSVVEMFLDERIGER